MSIAEAAARLLEAARNVAVAARPIPSGVEYSRKFATSVRVRQRADQLNEKAAGLTARLLALNGARRQDVSQTVSILLRRGHRRAQISSERQKRRADATWTQGTAERQTKIARNDVAAAVSSTTESNFAVEFRPQLEDKPHDVGEPNQPPPSSAAPQTKPLRAWYQSVIENQGLPDKPGWHPYSAELDAWRAFYEQGQDQWDYGFAEDRRKLLLSPVPIEKPAAEFDIRLVRTQRELETMIDHVFESRTQVIAVDVEHHSTFTFRGRTCLIQVGVGSTDFLVDPLALPPAAVTQLNQIFACPSILKVLHGCQYDVHWLQRDFSLYFVGVFDTYFACLLLRMPGGNSLANLVKTYCQIELDKTLQAADWRQRPLTDEMQHYAAGDTHYLVYLFGCLRDELLSGRNDMASQSPNPGGVTQIGLKRIMTVLEQSRLLCLETVKFGYPNLQKLRGQFDRKFGVRDPHCVILDALFVWRDWAARVSDITPTAVMSDLALFNAWNQVKNQRSTAIPPGLAQQSTGVGYRLWPQFVNLLAQLQAASDPTTQEHRALPAHHPSATAVACTPNGALALQSLSEARWQGSVVVVGGFWNGRSGTLQAFSKIVGQQRGQPRVCRAVADRPVTRLHFL